MGEIIVVQPQFVAPSEINRGRSIHVDGPTRLEGNPPQTTLASARLAPAWLALLRVAGNCEIASNILNCIRMQSKHFGGTSEQFAQIKMRRPSSMVRPSLRLHIAAIIPNNIDGTRKSRKTFRVFDSILKRQDHFCCSRNLSTARRINSATESPSRAEHLLRASIIRMGRKICVRFMPTILSMPDADPQPYWRVL